ncbi:O-methyltransferase [Smaragdicoccus niigatensis]|uniref:O-methyltransferase n=1 Tax=Smaragdicoccus niigatensis TaxID=359359 RepID=UPI000360AFE0|nr:class I SAM-dependent methyltransferase [Smaragdicoccus niigatensis]
MTGVIAKIKPFLRPSTIRLLVTLPRFTKSWQVGDGREDAVLDLVLKTTRPGDLDAVIRTIDKFGHKSILVNVGDEKGLLLDAAIERCQPTTMIELGAYVGYSALRAARVLPEGAHLYSVELTRANADITRRMLEHAGVGDRVTVVDGKLGDPATVERLDAVLSGGRLDFAFIDHAKDAYLPDLETMIGSGWLHAGSVVVADNVKMPGAPEYLAYMRAAEGSSWNTIEHDTHVEYVGVLKDLVLESTYLG